MLSRFDRMKMGALWRPHPSFWHKALASLSLLLWAASGACTSKNAVEVDDDTMIVAGRIDGDLEAEFVSKITEDIQRIEITSKGGEVSSALAIGEEIAERGIDVEAVDYCISACASYIWVSGSNRSVRENTILAFHGGDLPLLALYEKSGSVYPDLRPAAMLIENAKRIARLYAQLGVDKEFAFAASYARGLICLDTIELDDGTISLGPTFRATGFIPTASFLNSYGIDAQGSNLPSSQEDLEQIFAAQGGAENWPYFVMAIPSDEALQMDEIERSLPPQGLTACDPGAGQAKTQ